MMMGISELEEFIINQEDLPPDFAKVLYDNLWDLYDSSSPQPAIQVVQTDEQNNP